MKTKVEDIDLDIPMIDSLYEVTADALNRPVNAINRALTGVDAPLQVRTGGIRPPDETLLPAREPYRTTLFPERLTPWNTMDLVTADKLNQTVDAVNAILGKAQAPIQRKRDTCLPLVIQTRIKNQNDPPVPPIAWSRGERITLDKLNAPARALNKMYFGARPPQQVRRDFFPCS